MSPDCGIEGQRWSVARILVSPIVVTQTCTISVPTGKETYMPWLGLAIAERREEGGKEGGGVRRGRVGEGERPEEERDRKETTKRGTPLASRECS